MSFSLMPLCSYLYNAYVFVVFDGLRQYFSCTLNYFFTRNFKVWRSQSAGAVGVILYSDPEDYNAPWATDVYPESIWMPETATRRGDLYYGTGDPLTPGYPSIGDADNYAATSNGWDVKHTKTNQISVELIKMRTPSFRLV